MSLGPIRIQIWDRLIGIMYIIVYTYSIIYYIYTIYILYIYYIYIYTIYILYILYIHNIKEGRERFLESEPAWLWSKVTYTYPGNETLEPWCRWSSEAKQTENFEKCISCFSVENSMSISLDYRYIQRKSHVFLYSRIFHVDMMSKILRSMTQFKKLLSQQSWGHS